MHVKQNRVYPPPTNTVEMFSDTGGRCLRQALQALPLLASLKGALTNLTSNFCQQHFQP